jgi:hypothetical protein
MKREQQRIELVGIPCRSEGLLLKSDWGTLVPRINVENRIKLGFILE